MFTSALIRAQLTGSIILETINQTKIEVIKDKALNERFYGDLQGLNKDECREKWGEEHPFSALDFTRQKEVHRSPWNLPVSSKRGKRILMELRDLAAVGELSKARDYWKRHQKAVRPLMTAAAFNQLTERLLSKMETVTGFQILNLERIAIIFARELKVF